MNDITLNWIDEVSVKLRRASDNAKVPRKPSNILLAIQSLTREYCDLQGEGDAARDIVPAVAQTIARERGLPAGEDGEHVASSTIAVAVEGLVNMGSTEVGIAEGLGRMIVKEVADIFEENPLGAYLKQALDK